MLAFCMYCRWGWLRHDSTTALTHRQPALVVQVDEVISVTFLQEHELDLRGAKRHFSA